METGWIRTGTSDRITSLEEQMLPGHVDRVIFYSRQNGGDQDEAGLDLMIVVTKDIK